MKKSTQTQASEPTPRLRTDARRDYEHLLACADAAFSEDGAEASLEDIAKRAGVGIGTLCRHFQNRDVLLAATLEDRLVELGKKARRLIESPSAGEALAMWLKTLVKHAMTYQGLARSLIPTRQGLTSARDGMKAAEAEPLARAQASGESRSDIGFEDVISMTVKAYAPWADGTLRDFSIYNMSWGWTAGEMISTPHDVNRFYHALLSGQLLRPAHLAEMQMIVPNPPDPGAGYGLGLSFAQLPCGPVWGHTGGVVGHSTFTLHRADDSRRVTLAENLIRYSPPGQPHAINRARSQFLVAALCGVDALAPTSATVDTGFLLPPEM